MSIFFAISKSDIKKRPMTDLGSLIDKFSSFAKQVFI